MGLVNDEKPKAKKAQNSKRILSCQDLYTMNYQKKKRLVYHAYRQNELTLEKN